MDEGVIGHWKKGLDHYKGSEGRRVRRDFVHRVDYRGRKSFNRCRPGENVRVNIREEIPSFIRYLIVSLRDKDGNDEGRGGTVYESERE